jgi:hypothetical protein
MSKPKRGDPAPKKTAKDIALDRAGTREPNKKEKAAIEAARESYAARPGRASFVQRPSASENVLDLACPHTDAEGQPYLVADTLASSSDDFVNTSILHVANATTRGGKPSIEGLNASLAIVAAIAPRDELESALAQDMAATHALAMDMLHRTRGASNRDAMKDYGNMATKLSRTFTAQMKQLSDWRRGGEQVVRHVHVYEGGQAVVAETVNLGGLNEKSRNHSHALSATLLGEDAPGHALPGASHSGPKALSHAQRARKGDAGE